MEPFVLLDQYSYVLQPTNKRRASTDVLRVSVLARSFFRCIRRLSALGVGGLCGRRGVIAFPVIPATSSSSASGFSFRKSTGTNSLSGLGRPGVVVGEDSR